jgi:hypothetical protein
MFIGLPIVSMFPAEHNITTLSASNQLPAGVRITSHFVPRKKRDFPPDCDVDGFQTLAYAEVLPVWCLFINSFIETGLLLLFSFQLSRGRVRIGVF